jgi:hypothetical protein
MLGVFDDLPNLMMRFERRIQKLEFSIADGFPETALFELRNICTGVRSIVKSSRTYSTLILE